MEDSEIYIKRLKRLKELSRHVNAEAIEELQREKANAKTPELYIAKLWTLIAAFYPEDPQVKAFASQEVGIALAQWIKHEEEAPKVTLH
jgi:hypothetical protein